MNLTLKNPNTLREILIRVDRLAPESPRRWGTMTAPRMVCHVVDSLKVALGDQAAEDSSSWMSRHLGKWLVLGLRMPVPKGRIKTAPEMLLTLPGDWTEDRDNLKSMLKRVAAGEACSPHPAFGPLSPDEWAALAALHLDHHLRQFHC